MRISDWSSDVCSSDLLSRYGARVEIANITSEGVSVADVILDQAAERDANLLVIGAYSHPRTTEILFGGVTRSLLSSARVPLLRSEEHTSELQSLMRISYAVFCLKKKNIQPIHIYLLLLA